MNELTILANKYGSDKGTEYGDKHNFTETYEKYFKSFKHKSINILEIGINDGSSLKMWYDYFPNATIYGVDINDKSNFSNEKVKCIVLDQSKKEDLEEFVKNINISFDIIIDDGSHHISDQQLSFGSLFPLLKDDGIYVIEDLHTSLCEPNKMLYGRPMENNVDKTNTTLYYLQNKQYVSEYLSQDENNYIQNNIGSVKIYEKENSHEWKKSITSIITKKLKIKLLYLTPHLSTGGMPQFVLKRIEELQKFKDQIEIFLVEYSQFSNTYVVQRDKIIDILGEGHFFSLGDTTDTKRKYELIDIIKNNNIDVVHSEEMVEGFESFNKIPLPLLNQLYSNDRTWKMVETCHNVWFNPQTHKKFNPEAYCFVTPYHLKETFLNETPIKFLSLYPIENKVTKILEENEIYGDFNQVPLIEKIKVRNELGLDMFKTHVLNVGLWTSGKNQGEGVEVARELIESNPDIEFHFIGNQAPNFEDYWGPIMNNLPSNVKVWGERNDVEKFMTACDVLMFNSTWECNPLVVRESINYGMKILARDLPQYMGMFDGYITPIEGDVKNISKQLVELIENKDVYKILPDDTFGEDLLNFYNAVTNINITQNKPLTKDYTFVRHYVTQPYFEIQGTTENKLNIKYYDDKNEISYQNELSINSWVKLNKEYFIKWRTTVEENGEIIYDETLDLKDKRVYISFGSKSLGDTMAWIPYCEVFRKKHGCQLIVSTFLNSLFKDQYPEIEFVEPGDLVPNIHAQYRLGWHYTSEGVYDNNKHPFDFKKIPLQKTATDILGLDYEEIRPLLKLPNTPKKKKVGIGFHSTAQAKYWNNPDAWQTVIDHLNNLGYECMVYSKEGDGYMNNHYPEGVTIFKGGNLQEVIDDLSSCEFFIGLGSGLSWLAWACKLPVVLISGFSEKWAETTLDTYRVINENVCHGCFNSDRLDAGDWNWCPLHKNTDRMFECTKEISSDMVIKEINKIINKEVMEEKIDEVSFDWGGRSDWYIKQAEEEIFEGNTYERFFEVEEGDIVVDLGASLGPFTYKILPKNPKQCYVVEPISHQIEILKKNVGQENVKIIQGAITDKKKIEISWDEMTESVPTFSFREFLDEHKINKIDFLKCDCEGGEYDVFQQSNIEFLKTIPKIVTEFHLNNDSNYHECKFRWFRDNILTQFDNIQVFSVDGVNIKWDLWNDHFIEYYSEVILYIDNRK
jgi:autotransporter strand-loop-strand O-heptosyltransferase